MNIKKILMIACLGIFACGGTAKADDPNEQMRWSFNLIAHLLGGANDSNIKAEIDKFCTDIDAAGLSKKCDRDIWFDRDTKYFYFPNSLAGFRNTNLIAAFKKSPLVKDNVCGHPNQYCDKGYWDVFPKIPVTIMQAACIEVGCSSWETQPLSSAIWSEPNLGSLVESNCKNYCAADKSLCAGGDGTLPRTWAGAQCIYDAFKAHPEESFAFLLKNQDKILPYGGTPLIPIPVVGAVCQKHCTKSACNFSYKQNDCMALCCEISHGTGATTDYLADCESLDPGPPTNLCKNFLQTQQWKRSLQGNHQSKANVKAAHPMVLPQNNKALRGNAPQTVRPRGVAQPLRMAPHQPRVMQPLNQGKNAPQQNPHHPGMMHVDPHHPAVMPPVNQGKNAPQQKHPGMMHVDPHHPAMMPLENRGRTTPPKMMKVNPPHSGMVPLQTPGKGIQPLRPLQPTHK